MTYDDVVAAPESLADEKLRAFNARIKTIKGKQALTIVRACFAY